MASVIAADCQGLWADKIPRPWLALTVKRRLGKEGGLNSKQGQTTYLRLDRTGQRGYLLVYFIKLGKRVCMTLKGRRRLELEHILQAASLPLLSFMSRLAQMLSRCSRLPLTADKQARTGQSRHSQKLETRVWG